MIPGSIEFLEIPALGPGDLGTPATHVTVGLGYHDDGNGTLRAGR